MISSYFFKVICVIKNWFTSIGRSIRYLRLRFLRLKGSDTEMAEGFALGIFIGMTPTMGIQIPLALMIAMLAKRHKIAALSGIFITNPLTVIPIYTLNFKVGKILLSTPNLAMPNFRSITEIFALGRDLVVTLCVGSILVGIISGIFAYFFVRIFYKIYRSPRKKY